MSDGEKAVPFVDARFPEWGEVFEEVHGVFEGLALLTNKSVDIFSLHCAL